MFFAEVPTWVTDAGSFATAIAAVIGVIILLSRLKPVKWLWNNLVRDPFSEWLHETITREVAPIKKSMEIVQVELVDHMHVENELRREDLANRELRQAEHDARHVANNERFEALESTTGQILTRLERSERRQVSILKKLVAGNPDVTLSDEELLENPDSDAEAP